MKNEFKKTLCLLTVFLLTLSMIPGGVFAENTQPDQKTATVPDVAIEGQTTLANTVEVDSAKIENPTVVNSSPNEGKINLPQLNNEEAVVPQTNANVTDTLPTQTISGEFYYQDIAGGVSILSYTGQAAEVVIPDTLDGKSVIAIGYGAFKNSDFLTQVIIPDSVTTLEDGILRDCDNLEKLTLGKGVSKIPPNMVNNCLKLREVVFNGAIVSIGSGAFRQCPKLEISKLPETLETIGSGAFYRCTNLTNLTIPNKTTTIGSAAFVYCEKLENITLGNSLTTLDTGAFSYCNSLKEVALPKSLATIKSGNVFVGCPVLSKVVIPDTTTSITSNIFEKSPLTTIYGSKGSYAQTFAAKYSIPFVVNQPSTDVSNVSILYRTHVQNYGWQDFKKNGGMSGTSNEGLRLEGIEIKLDQQQYNLSVDYQTHVQNYGWQDWKNNGNMSGTSNEGLRLEAIRIKLSGADADKFDIYYRVHAQNVGWMGWAQNGADAGTAGYGYRLEGVEIKVLTKGSPAPGTIQNPFLEKK